MYVCLRRTLILIVLALAGTAVTPGPGAAQETVDGDAEAWREVVTSLRRVTELTSYRMRLSGSPVYFYPLTTYVVEVVNPDQFHVFFDLGAEYVIVGREARARLARSGPLSFWLCLPSTQETTIRTETGETRELPLGAFLTDALESLSPPVPALVALMMGKSSGAMTAVTISREPDRTIDGVTIRVYKYWVTVTHRTGFARGIRERLFVIPNSGLPRRIEILDAGETHDQTMDLFDYNAPISITLPRCR
jgi:hypothetical protein